METGAGLLGIVNEDGSVGFISTPVLLDAAMIEDLQAAGNPETSFRFSGTCLENGCKQWANGNCGVIKNVMEANKEAALESQLPDCSIRESCRWYFQEGAVACSFCPFIITNNLERNQTETVL
jgi:hypothetical protein